MKCVDYQIDADVQDCKLAESIYQPKGSALVSQHVICSFKGHNHT